jgi:hypothetical protein
MAKQVTFNVSTLFAATMAAVNNTDADATAAIAAGASTLNRASLEDCVVAFITGETSERASRAGKLAATARAATLLDAKGIDTSDVNAVRDVLWPIYWLKAGGKGQPVKGEGEEALAFYNRHFQAARRMAQAVAGVNAPEAATVRVPREAQDLANLLAVFDAKVVAEAMKRARKAAKKAK